MITSEQFVKKWMEAHKLGEDASWLAKELGITLEAARNKKGWLKYAGVELPKLITKAMIKKEKLNDIIREGMNNEG